MSEEVKDGKYMSKQFLANICSGVFEDILKATFDEEEPASQAPRKCSKETQTIRRAVIVARAKKRRIPRMLSRALGKLKALKRRMS